MAATISSPRVLLVDDDPVFGALAVRVGEALHIGVTYLESVNDLPSFAGKDFDVGVIDFDLGTITGLQLSELLDRFVGNFPVVLISGYRHIDPKRWPRRVTSFLSKQEGVQSILQKAVEVAKEKTPAALTQ